MVICKASRNPVQGQLRSGTCLRWILVLFVAVVAMGGTAPVRAQPRQTMLFVDTAAGTVGEVTTTQVVVFVADGSTVSSFEIELEFQPLLVEPTGVLIADGWLDESNDAPSGPSVQIGGRREDASCTGGSTCLLATLSWNVLQPGDAALTFSSASLIDEAGQPLELQTSNGSISVTHSPQPGTAQGNGQALGVGNGVIGLAALLLAGTALAAPLVAWRMRQRVEPVRSPPALRPAQTDRLASAVTDYLASYESAGRIDVPVDPLYEQMARQRPAEATENFPAIRHGRNGPILRNRQPKSPKE